MKIKNSNKIKVDFEKMNGLVPAIVQDATTLQVLMLGYMNEAALETTQTTGNVTFFSRSKNRLWTKGETSGNYLKLVDLKVDCDQDTILVRARPIGPTCHTGSFSCFGEQDTKGTLYQLEATIAQRKGADPESSYTASLFSKGTAKIAQKVGEEAVEVVIEAMGTRDDLFLNEAADLMYHYLVLLQQKGFGLKEVEAVLGERSRQT